MFGVHVLPVLGCGGRGAMVTEGRNLCVWEPLLANTWVGLVYMDLRHGAANARLVGPRRLFLGVILTENTSFTNGAYVGVILVSLSC